MALVRGTGESMRGTIANRFIFSKQVLCKNELVSVGKSLAACVLSLFGLQRFIYMAQ